MRLLQIDVVLVNTVDPYDAAYNFIHVPHADLRDAIFVMGMNSWHSPESKVA